MFNRNYMKYNMMGCPVVQSCLGTLYFVSLFSHFMTELLTDFSLLMLIFSIVATFAKIYFILKVVTGNAVFYSR